MLDSDAAVRLRKIWELGTDRIVIQTIVMLMVIVTRFQRGVNEEILEFYLNVHNKGVDTAVKALADVFEAFATLIGGVANSLFGAPPDT